MPISVCLPLELLRPAGSETLVFPARRRRTFPACDRGQPGRSVSERPADFDFRWRAILSRPFQPPPSRLRAPPPCLKNIVFRASPAAGDWNAPVRPGPRGPFLVATARCPNDRRPRRFLAPAWIGRETPPPPWATAKSPSTQVRVQDAIRECRDEAAALH